MPDFGKSAHPFVNSHHLTTTFVNVFERINDVLMLSEECLESLRNVYEYFDFTYVRGRPQANVGAGRRRGRGRAAGRGRGCEVRRLPPRYCPHLWNQYDSVLQRTARTNNISEGWHNRLNTVVGKKHPSLYAFLGDLQKEQADVEIMKRQLLLGQKVKKNPDPKRIIREEEMLNIILHYDEDYQKETVLEYFTSVASNIRL